MKFGIICQNFESGLCLKGSACPFMHNTFKIDADDNMGVKFKSEEINWGKKKKKHFFEKLEDIPLKSSKLYSKTESQQLSELDKDFENFTLFNEVKDENNKIIKYCKDFLDNKCMFKNCSLYHGYNDNLKNITRIFNYEKEKIIKIILINKENFLTASKYLIRFYTVKRKFKVKGEVAVNEFENKNIEIQDIFYLDNTLFTSEFNNYNKSISIAMRYENFAEKMFKLSADSSNKNIGQIIFLKNESLILCFGDIYLEMYRTNVQEKKIERIQRIQVEAGFGFSSVILFNGEFICGLKNGVIGIIIPNKQGSEIFRKRYEVKHHDDEITKVLMLELDKQTHYFITGSLDKKMKLFNYERQFSLIYSKDLIESINNLFFCRDYNNNLLIMVSLCSGIIKVLDDKFNEIFNITGPNNQNCARYGINIYIDFNDSYDDNEDESEKSRGNYLILNYGTGIEINKWLREK